MPTIYGPQNSRQATWTQENLDKAFHDLQTRNISIRRAASANNIPEKTLRSRLRQKKFAKGNLGKRCHLGEDVEKQLVQHITTLQSAGFVLSKKNLRKIAFDLSEKMGLRQIFNTEKRIAGLDWYKSFIRRHPVLSVKRPKGSNAYTNAVNKQDIDNYFHLLRECLNDNNLMNKPTNIYNMAEIDLQLNNEPDLLSTVERNSQGSQCPEGGKSITVVACCSASGSFLPPYCIFEGGEKPQIWEEDMPRGFVIQVRKESANINEQIFLDWLENNFISEKNKNQCLLILNDRSYINSPDVLQMAADNNIHILCLPCHVTHYFQPLNRSFFGSLKTYYREACCEWSNMNPTEKIQRNHFGLLFGKAWTRAATVETGRSGFRETGIFPFYPTAILEHAYVDTEITKHEEFPLENCNKEILCPPAETVNSSCTQICTITDESVAQSEVSNFSQQSLPSLEERIEIYQAPIYSSRREILSEVLPITSDAQASSNEQSTMIVTTPEVIDLENEERMSIESTCTIIESIEIDSDKRTDETEDSSLWRAPTAENENATTTVENENATSMDDFVYVDINQQSSPYNSQVIDYWEKRPVNMGQDPIEFTMQTDETHQPQRNVNFRNARPNETGPPPLAPCRNVNVISKNATAPAIDFPAQLKTNDTSNAELTFFQSLIPDIMKLSGKRRRQFKEAVMSTLNKFLDEEESACATKT